MLFADNLVMLMVLLAGRLSMEPALVVSFWTIFNAMVTKAIYLAVRQADYASTIVVITKMLESSALDQHRPI